MFATVPYEEADGLLKNKIIYQDMERRLTMVKEFRQVRADELDAKGVDYYWVDERTKFTFGKPNKGANSIDAVNSTNENGTFVDQNMNRGNQTRGKTNGSISGGGGYSGEYVRTSYMTINALTGERIKTQW